MLIALHSKGSRAGKDTIAGLLVQEYGFVRVGFGDDIYVEVAEAFGVTIEELGSDDWKRAPVRRLALEHCTNREFATRIQMAESKVFGIETVRPSQRQLEVPRTSRFILQRWATEYRRSDDINYWVKKVNDKLISLEPDQPIVISDLREPHEMDYLMTFTEFTNPMPLRVVEVTRDSAVVTSHSSDRGIDQKHIQHLFTNNGTKEHLYDQVRAYMSNLKGTV